MNYLDQYPMTAQERAKIVELHGVDPEESEIPAFIRQRVSQTGNIKVYLENGNTNEKS
jgi:hypothetical protein